MAFFKLYTGPTNRYSFKDSIEHNGFIYSIGWGSAGRDKGALLKKLDLDGNVIFSRLYNIEGGTTMFVTPVISNSGELIISGFDMLSNKQNFICRININNGDLLWNRFFPNTTGYGRAITQRNLVILDNNSFLYVTQYNDTEHVIHKFDFSGNLILSRIYNIRTFDSYGGICVSPSGSSVVLLTNNDILYLDNSLNLISKRRISGNGYFNYCSFINENEFLINRANPVGQNGFIELLKLNLNQIGSISNAQVVKIDNVGQMFYQKIHVDGNRIYLTVNDSAETAYSSSIVRFNTNLEVVWTKRLNVGISTVLDPNNRQLSLDDSVNGQNNQILLHSGNSLILTDLQLSTCLTEEHTLQITSETKNFTESEAVISPDSKQIVPISFDVDGIVMTGRNVCPSGQPLPDLTKSTITADPPIINADGTSTSEITVTLKDAQENVITDFYQVVFNTDAGTLPNPTVGGYGIYKTNLTSSLIEETATVGFTVTGIPGTGNTTEVQFKELGTLIEFSDITAIQSEHLYLQASGSDGSDSTKGRHLRWAFRGTLGEKHLPKGNYAANQVNFNKQQDFVNIYKAEYIKKTVTLDLVNDIPDVVDHNNYLWIYKPGGTHEFYIRFANKEKYDEVKLDANPLFNPYQFITDYGSELIEVENIKELFFAVTCNFATHTTTNRTFQVETLTVNSNNLVASKIVSNRKTVSGSTQFSGQPMHLQLENGRSIRWRIFNAKIASLDFELYSDAIKQINEATGWEELGEFALTLQDATAWSQLEPAQGDVHGLWQRFNEGAFVNINNYHDKWSSTTATGDKNIKKVVEDYIALSNNAGNFAAIENVPLGNDLSDPEDYLEVSNLDMLNFAAYDFHIARMLGLGILDIEESQQVSQTKYVYVAEYFTSADLEDGLGPREVQHLFMSLPTSETDFRLPVPIELDQIVPGVFIEGKNGQYSSLTDQDGYTHNGISRYVSLYTKELKEDELDSAFFENNEQIDSASSTTPVYGGLRYRINSGDWQKPELANDPDYYNAVPQGQTAFYETRFLLVPEPLKAFYVHKQSASGTHRYKSYGINWFSRAKIANAELNIETALKQKNPLIPPSNTHALLIRTEKPLMLTSQQEQDRLGAIEGGDKTLIRLTYDYHSFHELKSYNVPIDSPLTNTQLLDDPAIFPDSEEIFADEVDIFFRNQLPANVKGKALSVNNHSTNPVLSVITTGTYQVVSTGQTYVPYLAPGTEANYIGGVFISGDQKYIIHSVTQATEGPVFTVYKKELSDSVFAGETIPVAPYGQLQSPILVDGGLFMVVENMQNTGSWGMPNPLGFKVKIGDNWGINREVIENTDSGNLQRVLEKTRGIWGNAQVALEAQANQPGIYKITFNNFVLGLHPQYNGNGVSAEWYGGIVRIFTESAVTGTSYNKTRKVFPVIKIENAGTSNNLVLYIQDPSYDPNDQNYDYIQTGSGIKVNFYPGYKVYLYADNPFGINEQNIFPAEGESVRYSIFGFRSRDINGGCDPVSGSCLSKISVPCMMFAQELIEALPPEQPDGPLYATRPDFFGRSTYTLTTEYQHKPYGVLFYRSNDEALLNALYKKDTIKIIRENLEELGGNNEEDLTDRWTNFLNFEELASAGDYNIYPSGEEGYKFPNPDKQAFFDWANHILAELGESPINGDPGTIPVGDSQIINFVKGAVYNAFVSLTEVPILYQYLNGAGYQPVDKPQVIRDRNGHTLPPYDPKAPNAVPNGFEMAPMMKITGGSGYETLFTDFKLDGTSNNLYFYGVKELSTQMNMSPFSTFLGPVKLVNTNAPEAPEIKRIIPVLENQVIGISPHIQLEINAFPRVQNVKKVTIYRAKSFLDAQSVQTMQLVKIVDLEDENLLDEPIWTVTDNFEDLTEIPYGDGLFYRVTASREVRYADSDQDTVIEYAPSQASKIVASLMMEANAPQSPVLEFTSTDPDSNLEIHSVTLKWSKTAYKAKYHVYKMNSQGNWTEIYQFQTNDDEIELPLTDTDLQSGTLKLTNEEGDTLYHHFKVIAENTAGMLSIEENILTIYPHIGIGEMIIGSTFIVW